MEKVIANLNEILAKINLVCAEKSINPQSIELIAASKFRDVEVLRALNDDGRVTVFGENKVQEFKNKYDENLTWDIIGQLQTNKVKYVVGKVRYISSVDRIALAAEIDRIASQRNVVQKCLIEVNSGEEDCKGGLTVGEVDSFLTELHKFSHIKICGIMAVAPQGVGEENLKKCFKKVKEKFDEINARDVDFNVLSMGMSEDFLTAIECGSNQVRLGRILFGERPQVL